MPNRKNTAQSLQANGSATLSHDTATAYFKLPLKGTKAQQLAELSLYMRLHVAFIIQAIENDIAGPDNEEVMAAIYLYLEAKTAHYYLSNNIQH